MEQVLKESILNHLKEGKVIRNSQHGFTKGASITERRKEMERVNAEKSLPFRTFALLSFLPQKMFILRGTEQTEDNQSTGIITKIFELWSQPFQMLEKFIRFPWVNQDQIQEGNGGASITERSKEIESVNAEKSLPFRIFALLSFLPQKMFIFQEKALLSNDNEKTEVSEHRGIIANILALGSRPMQLCKNMIQTLNPFDKFQLENDNEKAEVSEHKGIIANILARGSQSIQLCKNMIQTLNPFDKLKKENDKFRNELDNLQEKMKELQKENEWRRARNKKDDITLDAGTAHPNLCIAGDKKSLKYEAQPQKVPPHPERFDSTVCVLGSEGFSSGKHYWEVDVGSSTYWDLGVARKSIERKGKLSLSPKQGFWALSLNGGDYWAKTDPWTRIMVQKKPKKIGVYLGYQDRQVTFFSVTDMSVLFTFNDCSFSGEVYPFLKNSHKGTTMRISSIKEEE